MEEILHIDGTLEVSAGQATRAGAKDANEDCIGMRMPDGTALTLKGVAAVIADGVSNAEAGREASESCVQSFLADYYSTPDSWAVETSARAVLTALNRWLYSRTHHATEAHRGYVSTLSALVLKSHTAHLFHVGDTRIYRLRDGQFEQLTRDHSTHISDEETYLIRAVGMDVRLEVDYRTVDLKAGDLFLLTTDGVHDSLTDDEMKKRIVVATDEATDLEKLCQDLIERAQCAGSQDNLSCQLLRVDALPPDDVDAAHQRLSKLPFPPPLEPGLKLDGYLIEREIHASSRSQLYLVTDLETNRRLVMKTPSVNYEDDPAYIERFVMEPWIGRRIAHRNVIEIEPSERPQSFLYYVMAYLEGPSLRQWIDENPDPDIGEVLDIVDQLVAGLRAFERKETLHQDLKPENIVFDGDGVLKILDFGSCHVAGIQEIHAPIAREHALGTARYSAPESRRGENAGIRSEIFSLGSIVYEMLTGELPYTDKFEDAMTVRALERLEYVASHHHNPMVPVWMDGALRTAVSLLPRRRYGVLSEFVYDLRNPNPSYLKDTRSPLIQRDPLLFWKGLAALLGLGWLATLAYLMQ
jgi:serine/threonine protein phosphatase PrpC